MNTAPGREPVPQEVRLSAEQERDFYLVETLFQDIKTYNSEHSMFSVVGKAIARSIDRQAHPDNKEADDEEVGRNIQQETTQSAYSGLIQLVAKNSELLKRYGLTLTRSVNYLDPNETYDGVSFTVEDIDVFIKNIKLIKPLIAEDEKKEFSKIVKDLEAQIHFNNVEEKQNPDLILNTRIPEISKALHETFPSSELKKIDTYALFSRNGRLKNYVAVDREYLWHEPGVGFGPADWVTDITPEGLEKKWSHALTILRIQDREEGLGVASELREHLLKCITVAFEKVGTLSWSETIKEQFKAILIKYTQLIVGDSARN